MNISLESLANDGIKEVLKNEKLVDKKSEFFGFLKKYYNS